MWSFRRCLSPKFHHLPVCFQPSRPNKLLSWHRNLSYYSKSFHKLFGDHSLIWWHYCFVLRHPPAAFRRLYSLRLNCHRSKSPVCHRLLSHFHPFPTHYRHRFFGLFRLPLLRWQQSKHRRSLLYLELILLILHLYCRGLTRLKNKPCR